MDIKDIKIGMKVRAKNEVGEEAEGYVRPNDIGVVVHVDQHDRAVQVSWGNPMEPPKDIIGWWISVDNISTEGIRYKSWELMKLAEECSIGQYSLYRDQDGNVIIYTGKSFQIYDTKFDDKYVGLCVGDEWEFVGVAEDSEVDEDDQELITKLRYNGIEHVDISKQGE